FYMPQIGGVIRAEILMSRAQPPTVEADFKRAHEVFARQYRMLLIPNDALAEIQIVLLQEWRIVAEVGIPAPNVEPATDLQHAGHVSEPGVEQFVKRFGGHEVVGQW